ncbi:MULTISPECIES: phage tail spike protein [Gammaproteobacteria]|uniref:phage tail spike protein n=1 Tax=Acinetobacter sp. HRXRD-152 TaxID=3404808 RepID=UPI003BB60D22
MNTNKLYIFDGKTEELVSVFSNASEGMCSFFDAKVSEELNRDFLFEFLIPVDHADSEFATKGNLVAFKDMDNTFQLFTIYQTEEEKSIDGSFKVVTCEHSMYEIIDDIVVDKTIARGTAQEALTIALSNSRWKVGTVASLGRNDVEFKDTNGIKSLNNIGELYGGEYRYRVTISGNKITDRYVDLLERRGSDTGKRFEYRKDMNSIKRTTNMTGLKTALYGRGKADENDKKLTFANIAWSVANGDPVDKPLGQEWVGSPEALKQYGRENGTRHRFGFIDHSGIDTANALLGFAWSVLKKESKPRVSYEMKVTTLEDVAGFEHDKVRMGDTVSIVDKEFVPAIRVEARIIKMEYALDDPSNVEVTLGNFIPLSTDFISELDDLKSKIQEKESVWDKAELPINDGDFPDTPPQTPTGYKAKGMFKYIKIDWDYIASSYIAYYEVFGSKTPNFPVDPSNLLYRGKAGGFVHQADTNETWYYKVRAANYHGTVSEFTPQFTGQTLRIKTADYEELSIVDAVISDLSADKLTAGTIDAGYIDVINLDADNIVAGTIKADNVSIGSGTTYADGYDPSSKETPGGASEKAKQALADANEHTDKKSGELKSQIDTFSDDNKLTLMETKTLQSQIQSLKYESVSILETATAIGIGAEKDGYVKALDNFDKYLNRDILGVYGNKISNNKTKAIWFWQATRIIAEADHILRIMSKAFITEIYIPYNPTSVANSYYQYFISKAHSLGMEVHALQGDKSWALSANRQNAMNVINNILAYNNSSKAEEKFDAIHFDVEPYLMPEWTSTKPEIIKQWIDNSDAWIEAVHNGGLKMGGSFAFWIDNPDSVGQFMPPEYAGKGLHEVFIEKYDYYATMSYRDVATGSPSIVSFSKTEVDYATTIQNKKVIVGIETTKQAEENISFYKKGYYATEQAIFDVDRYYKDFTGYRGMGIHAFSQIDEWIKEFDDGRGLPTYPVDITIEQRESLMSKLKSIQDKKSILMSRINDAKTVNILNNPTKTGKIDGWKRTSGTGTVLVEDVDFKGRTIKAIKANEANDLMFESNKFSVEKTKAYEFSFWVNTEAGDTASREFFGITAYDIAGQPVAVDVVSNVTGEVSSEQTLNPYFKVGKNPVGEWTKLTGYILPPGTEANSVKNMGKNVNGAIILSADVEQVSIKMMNWDNKGTSRSIYIVDPVAIPLSGDLKSIIDGAEKSIRNDYGWDTNKTFIDGGKIWTGTIKAESLHIKAKTKVNNFTNTGTLEDWTVTSGTSYGSMSLVTDPTLNATVLKMSNSRDMQVESGAFEVDPTKNYRISLQMNTAGITGIDPDTGTPARGYFGINVYDKNMTKIGVIPYEVKQRVFEPVNSNLYFWSGADKTGWRVFEAYVMSTNSTERDFYDGKGIMRHCKLPANAKFMRLIFLNNYNDHEHSTNMYVFSPVLTETDSGAINFSQGLGGTLTLGGANNTSGRLVVREATGDTCVDIDESGVNVKKGNFTLEDERSGLKFNLNPSLNMVVDHSFELIPNQGSGTEQNGYYDTVKQDKEYKMWATMGKPLLYVGELDLYNVAAFGRQYAVANNTNYFYQSVKVLPKTDYTLSFHIRNGRQNRGVVTTPRVQLEFHDGTNIISSIANNFSSSDSTFDRWSYTFTSPAFTEWYGGYVRIKLMSNDGYWIEYDGVQLIPGRVPSIYQPENSIWDMRKGHDNYPMLDGNGARGITNLSSVGAKTATLTTGLDGPGARAGNGYNLVSMRNVAYGDNTNYTLIQDSVGYVNLNTNAHGSAEISFPTSFTRTPWVMATARDSNSVLFNVGVYGITTTGCTVHVRHIDGEPFSGTVAVHVVAGGEKF